VLAKLFVVHSFVRSSCSFFGVVVLHFVFIPHHLYENGYEPLNEKGENGGRRLGVFAERKEITPLGGDSKISEEDPPL